MKFLTWKSDRGCLCPVVRHWAFMALEWPGWLSSLACGLVRLETGEMGRLVEPTELVVDRLPIAMRAYFSKTIL